MLTYFFALQRHFKNDLKIHLNEAGMIRIKKQLAAKCKMLRRAGKGNLPNRSCELTKSEVKLLFTSGVCGSHSPSAIINAVCVL